ncbi:HhH-GPD-type base excision DNA repair protein [Sporichthya sp.]|uniref:HhH-GPD-type base excision DNA repair protein n=1 Tax=Sporichthya sp. TaxID=65475 RepID=UPI00182154CF|nr:HhH-GPD-type base excision DNA repair protein [Sporichthya sp.]MBA3743491.1 Fe-S cluster assembly protein HesB [Sporichthya sp.]
MAATKTKKQAPARFCIAQDPAADEVLGSDPFAVVVGMMLDQQYGMEHAFRGGYKVLRRFGTLDPATIATADPDYFKTVCSTPPAIHRYPGSMSTRLQELATHVVATYDGDVTRLWTEASTGADLFKRVQQLPGFGKQKAQIFVALLAKQLGVRPEGWETVCGDYALDGHRSVADVTDVESLRKVREYKQQKKAAAKAAGT